MFIDEQSQIAIYADLDSSVSYGTLRPADVARSLLSVLRDTPQYLQIINYIPCYAWDNPDDIWWQDVGLIVLEDIFETLNLYAPEGYYFGAHDGDGADFGYWKNQ